MTCYNTPILYLPFDTIDHVILLSKLHDYGFRGPFFPCFVHFYLIENNLFKLGTRCLRWNVSNVEYLRVPSWGLFCSFCTSMTYLASWTRTWSFLPMILQFLRNFLVSILMLLSSQLFLLKPEWKVINWNATLRSRRQFCSPRKLSLRILETWILQFNRI